MGAAQGNRTSLARACEMLWLIIGLAVLFATGVRVGVALSPQIEVLPVVKTCEGNYSI